jgi:metallo-beta-lactamase family protein
MKIAFHGAARGVTGSCYLLITKDAEGKEHRLLIDCGMFQGERYADEANFEDFHFDASTIDAVFITHAHNDHIGRLPKLIAEGFVGPIYCTHPTRPLMRVVLEDGFHIMEENAKRNAEPLLYQKEDLTAVFEQCESVNYHETIILGPELSIMLHDAGHILGSAFIAVESEGKRTVFSGDLGNNDVPILPDTEMISSADAVIVESTYGNRTHESPKDRSIQVRKMIEQTIEKKGVLMIPSFSIERTQELLYEIDQLLLTTLKTKVPIFLDSPMAIRATEIYRHYQNYLRFDADILKQPDRDFFSFPNLQETLLTNQSKAIIDVPAPKIIIAGSGMMSGGRIMHHLKHYLPGKENQLLIIGYQVAGTLGRRLYEAAKKVKIYGQEVRVEASVDAIGSFSAHADQNKITRWLQPEDGKIPEKIVLVHGDPEVQEVFATHLRHNLKTEVLVPEFLDEIEI